jgi:hypothetical protein
MQGWIQELERRERARIVQRIPCVVRGEGGAIGATLEEVSAEGLLVSAAEDLPPGTETVVSFRSAEGEGFVLLATVRSRRPLARSLLSATQPRLGLRVLDPPDAYVRWLEGLQRLEGRE